MTLTIQERGKPEMVYKKLFPSAANLRQTILIAIIQAGCEMIGVSAIQYFSPEIFGQLHISTKSTLLFVAINACIGLCCTTVCILMIDRIGRRPLEIYDSFVMAERGIACNRLLSIH